MDVSAKLNWTDELRFSASVQDGRALKLNSADDMGEAFTPMELFLLALAGCTAMDVQWIMTKQRRKVDRFEISVKGIRREEDPRYYERIDLEYAITGDNITKNTVEHAIRLSQEKYCSVRAMLNEDVKLHIAYVIDDGKGAQQRFMFNEQI